MLYNARESSVSVTPVKLCNILRKDAHNVKSFNSSNSNSKTRAELIV